MVCFMPGRGSWVQPRLAFADTSSILLQQWVPARGDFALQGMLDNLTATSGCHTRLDLVTEAAAGHCGQAGI